MRKTGRSDHQGRRNAKKIEGVAGPLGIFLEPEVGGNLVDLLQEGLAVLLSLDVVTDQAELRNDVARDHHGYEDDRNGVGEDHHAVLGDLGVGDALHTAQPGVKVYDSTPDQDALPDFDGKES